MGGFASRFQHGLSALEQRTYSRPYEPEWIVEHARVSGLGLLHVERLWQRFQQLGSTDGSLKPTQIPVKIKNEAFCRLLVSKLQDDTHTIQFLVFCNFMAWLDTADLETKCRAIFQLLSKGKSVNKDQLYSIMKATFPAETEASVFKLTDIVMRSVDDRQQGYFTEDQFLNFLKRLPAAEVKRVLDFSIIPDYIDQNPDDREQIHDTYRSSSSEHSKQIPTDFILMEVAQKACRRDWFMLGNLLDFTSNSLQQFDNQNQEPRDKAFTMLKTWRDREGKRAYLIKLEKALRQSGMNDIAMILQP